MFNFIKKGVEKDEKEKRKKEKDSKKKRERGSMTAEELLRLDEVRRSLKIRGRRKDKEKLPSGITADYSENFFADLERDPEYKRSGSLPGHTVSKSSQSFSRGEISTQSDSSEASLNSLSTSHAPQKVLPPLPPRPPKRGILKGSKANIQTTDFYENHDPNILVRNTLQNEVIISQPENTDNMQSNLEIQLNSYLSPELSANHSQSGANYLMRVNDKNNLLSITSTSPSAESLTDTTNSSFATPPFSLSPIDESHGFGRINSVVDEKNIDVPLPEIVPFKLPSPRELTIYRTTRGDFGFQLRRAIVTDKLSKSNKKTVIFAEPGIILSNKNETGLLPGDVLLEVNGMEVHDKSREDIIDLIKSSNSSVTVKVQPIPELCELIRRSGSDGQEIVLDDSNIRAGTLRRSGSRRFKKNTAKSDEELANERACLEDGKLWLIHKGGFTAVRALSNASDQHIGIGRVKVKVENSDQVLEVDEDDLEKANPSQLDRIEDLTQLRYINESSVLYLLRQRYGNNLIHTYSAGNLIIINPQCTLSIYNEKVAALFRGCKSEDMPPHIYALAQTTYRSMLSTRKDQSIVLVGRSGSGKTQNFRHVLSYLLHCAGSLNKVLNVERLNALNTVIEAFGNARTCLNLNATRCTHLVNLDFDQAGQIASLSLQMLMLEKQRVAKCLDGELTFNVFYWLLAGAESSLAKQLFFDSSPPNNNLFVPSFLKNEDRQRAVMELSKLTLALKALGVTDKELFVLWSIIAVIYHLGHAGALQVGTNKWQFADPVHASKACRLLGTTSEELSQAIWDYPVSPTKSQAQTDKDKMFTGTEALEGFVIGLYSEVVTVVNGLINKCLTTNVHSTMSILVVDSPGFQNPASCGQQRGASFSDLCHNYVQERLHLLYHNVDVVVPRDRYTQEHIDMNMDEIYIDLHSPSQLISILDKAPSSGVLRTSQTDLREVDRRGLLWLLEEETIYPNSSDETFLERLFQHYGCKDHQTYIRKSSGMGHFVIQHFQGTSSVTYNAKGWLKSSRENPLNRVAANFLQESTKEDISELFITGKGLHLAVSDGSQSLRRVSSIRRTCSSAAKRKSISLQVKFITDGLIETLRRTRSRFVFCMLAQSNAGLSDLTPGAAINENILNVPLLRSQIRGAEILPATRIYKQGFPEYVPHGEFRRRFRLLATAGSDYPEQSVSSSGVTITVNGQVLPSEAIDEAREVEEMLTLMDIDIASYRIGLTQVFFRAGALAQLESQRDEKLADLIVQFQSRCRGYLARKKLAKLKVQDLAVRCIQKNVRKLMQVREWPWWRLYVKVTPLLNVHRTEEELTAKLQELEALKSKAEKLEVERNQLKIENDLLETKGKEKTLLNEIKDFWRKKNKSEKGEELENGRVVEKEKEYLHLDENIKPPSKSRRMGSLESVEDENIYKMEKDEHGINVSDVKETRIDNKKKGKHIGESTMKDTEGNNSDSHSATSKAKNTIRKSASGKEKPSSYRLPKGNLRRNSAVPMLPPLLNIQEKIEALKREASHSEAHKTQPKIHRLDDRALLVGREEKEKPRTPIRIASRVDPVFQSKILKFGMSSLGSKSKAQAINGYSVRNIQVKALKEQAEAESEDEDASVSTLSGSVELSLSSAAREEKIADDIVLVTEQIKELTKNAKTFAAENLKKSSNQRTELRYPSVIGMPTEKATVEMPVSVYRPEPQFDSKSSGFESLEEVEPETRIAKSRDRSPFSPFSIASDASYEHFATQSDRLVRSASAPRRIFPQFGRQIICDSNDRHREDSPVVIDAGLSFDLVRSSSVRQQIKSLPAFATENTSSNSLSAKIAEFLGRTDHVMEEWKRLGKADIKNVQSLVELPSKGYQRMKSKSVTNIIIKGMLNMGKQQRERSWSRPRSRNLNSSMTNVQELNEINADLSEERATGTLQAERLEAETAERVRLEQELSQVQQEKKNLLQTSERLEMELFYARADVNGLSEGEGDLDEGGGDAAMYKHKCERALRELEFTRRRLQQQHEDDLEQLVALKKQLEKKLADAYEEVEEQRQVAGQWKRKVQKFQSEMNDLRLLLEEQTSRNNLLEKKQRKFDSEIQLLQDEIRSEKNQKERLSREKEMAYAEKYSMEQNLSSVRLELELKEEKLETLTREVDELTRGGGSEQEVTQLRKAKHDLELKLKEEEEELDELAGQVSMLESTKLRLEMSLESLRKEHRREMSQREDELDEVRSNSQKKLKALEAQLENEHEERTLLLREKHELERRLNDAEERGRHHRAADEDALLRLRRDLKKTKALLRDAQMMLERTKQDSPSKAALRALKNQLEDAELARASAAKAKQSLESELSEVNGQLEEMIRAKGDVENRYQAVQRECNTLRTQVDENEEELAELLKKYRQTVQQLSAEQLAAQETAGALAEAEAERASLRDQLAELTAKLEASTMLSPISGMTQKRLEIRIKELESRLELEQTTRSRLEVQIARLKENMERMTEECIQLRNKEQMANDQTRKLQRALREAKEELAQQQAKEQEVAHKKRELEKRLETAEQEAVTARTDLRLAVKRIEDLQIAMSGEIASDSDRSESEAEEDSGDESLMLHLQNSVSSSRASKTPDLSPR